MTHLTLAGLSGDGKRLLLVDDQGAEFTLDADPRLRAALRGEHARLGQLEMKMDSSLRPRDIQARIRSGETPESVASAAGTTVEAIMPFAAPVMAERQHVAERAQRSSVRRSGAGPQAGARTLGEAVGGHLRSLNIDPDTVTWDSARREDGRWNLTADFSAGPRSGTARFTFDAPGNYVLVDNDDAQFLIGGAAGTEAPAPTPRDDLQQARARRQTAPPSAPADQLPLGDDALSLVSEEPQSLGAESLGAEAPVEAYLDDDAPTREQPAVDDSPVADSPVAEEPPGVEETTTESAAEESPARPARKKGRSSVPSWDEIMFGGGKND
jgi:hypothetical protein